MGNVYLVSRISGNERYAVKTLRPTLIQNIEKQRYFLREVRTWIDLPAHPNLVGCRFFRTVEDQLAIFLEYVDGGSLKSWIENCRLTQIERILDVAIQIAWGLKTAHDQGVIHQDIKPSNIMISSQGVPKITDFGLSRARLAGGLDTQQIAASSTILVSAEGLTPAYCSPEQAMGKKLSRKTDIWSYGVTILEMFYGKVKWKYGGLAPFALESLVEEGPNPPYPVMPEPLAGILWKCFETSPKSRWADMNEIADALVQAYSVITKLKYSRPEPASVARRIPLLSTLNWIGFTGSRAPDPQGRLLHALKLSGRKDSESIDSADKREGSRKALAIADLEMMSEACHIYSASIPRTPATDRELAEILSEKAALHFAIDDFHGAIGCLDRSISLMSSMSDRNPSLEDRLILVRMMGNKSLVAEQAGDWKTALQITGEALEEVEKIAADDPGRIVIETIRLWIRKARLLARLGQIKTAISLFDRSISACRTASQKPDSESMIEDLARAYSGKAFALNRYGSKREALDLLNQAISFLEELTRTRDEPDIELAGMYMNKALMLWDLDEHEPAVSFYDKTIAIRETLVYEKGLQNISKDLAIAYMNKALALLSMGKPKKALDLLSNAASILDRLVNFEGRNDLRLTLARAYCNQFVALDRIRSRLKSTEILDRAIEILEPLVEQDRRIELANELASVYTNKAIFLIKTDRYPAAVTFLDRAIVLRETLVEQHGKSEIRVHLAISYSNKARFMMKNGQYPEAAGYFHKAMSIFDILIDREGRKDLMNDRMDVQKELEQALQKKR